MFVIYQFVNNDADDWVFFFVAHRLSGTSGYVLSVITTDETKTFTIAREHHSSPCFFVHTFLSSCPALATSQV